MYETTLMDIVDADDLTPEEVNDLLNLLMKHLKLKIIRKTVIYDGCNPEISIEIEKTKGVQ